MIRKVAIFTFVMSATLAAVMLINQSTISESTAAETGKAVEKPSGETKSAVLGGGCFWCTETDFEHCPGVVDVVSGYSGGNTSNPNYQTYHDGHHTECAQITYDPKKVTFAGLVEWLVKHIDPTDAGGQFHDRGDGYKPIVFYETEEEKAAAQKVFEAIDAMKKFKAPLQIELKERSVFWPAEEYHQDFHGKKSAHYRQYRAESGRDLLIKKVWGKKAGVLELPGSLPEGSVSKGIVEK